ncbi:MAG: hypothetical protein AAB480_02550 [Patescibacteria group bacterium]
MRKLSGNLVVVALIVVLAGAVMACLLPGILMGGGHGHSSASIIGHIEHAKQLTQTVMTAFMLVSILCIATAVALFSQRATALPELTSLSSYRADRIPIPVSITLLSWLSLFESSPTTFRPA